MRLTTRQLQAVLVDAGLAGMAGAALVTGSASLGTALAIITWAMVALMIVVLCASEAVRRSIMKDRATGDDAWRTSTSWIVYNWSTEILMLVLLSLLGYPGAAAARFVCAFLVEAKRMWIAKELESEEKNGG